jgi:hypothetical protein
MLRIKSCARSCLAIMLVVPFIISACGTREQAEKPGPENRFDLSELTAHALLAVEVNVRADGLDVVSAKVIRGPSTPNSAEYDLLVTARAGDRTIAEYVIPDPRLAEVLGHGSEERGHLILPEAATVVFAPLTEDLTEIQIAPIKGREERASKGGTIDARTLAARACEGQTGIEECQRIPRSRPEQSPTPTPAPQTSPAQPQT